MGKITVQDQPWLKVSETLSQQISQAWYYAFNSSFARSISEESQSNE
jgi:hypothetical protein